MQKSLNRKSRTNRHCKNGNGGLTPHRLSGAIAFALSVQIASAQAATIQVDSTDDTIAADGLCTLREAIVSANDDAAPNADCANGSGADTVDLTGIARQTIMLSGERLPTISSEITIQAFGVTVDGALNSQLLEVEGASANLTIKDISLVNGELFEGFFARGGAIEVSSFATLALFDSTLSGNVAYLGAAISAINSTVSITNSTLSGNSAGASGAAIAADYSTINLVQSTITGNSADLVGGFENPVGGSALYLNGATLNISNSVVANTSGSPDCAYVLNSPTINQNGVNLVEATGDCGFTAGANLLQSDPQLGPLASNGGLTPTHRPNIGSPLIDAGNNSQAAGLSYDQRGSDFPRIFNGTVDLGSVETGPVTPQPGPDFVVTVTGDVNDGVCAQSPGHCSLREAVIASNANPDASTITIANNLLNPVPATITLAGAPLPTISTDVTIQADGVVFDGGNQSRIFIVWGGGPLPSDVAKLSLFDCNLVNGIAILDLGIVDSIISQITGGGGLSKPSGGAILGLWSGLNLENCIFSNNTTSQQVDGTGVFSGGGALALFWSSLTIRNSSFLRNSTSQSGGAIFGFGLTETFEMIGSTVTGNSAAEDGGAIDLFGGDMHMTQCVISGNSAGSWGGGGFFNQTEATINDCTISDNTASRGGAMDFRYGRFEIVNSTVSGNRGAGAYCSFCNTDGVGGINTNSVGISQIVHSTFDTNLNRSGESSDLRFFGIDDLTITNSILEGCTQGNGRILLAGTNIIEQKGNCQFSGTGLLLDVDPLLAPLADNGGPTLTHLPLPGSPAIDAGEATAPNGLQYDQRGPGFPRVFNSKVDLGAVETSVETQTGPDFVVTATDDAPSDEICSPAPGHCNLREAVLAANADADASTITFTNALLDPQPATVTLMGTELPTITTDITLLAEGVTISGNGQSRVFKVNDAGTELVLDTVNLVDGQSDLTSGGAISLGAGTSLGMSNSTLHGNTAVFGAGGLWAFNASASVSNSTFSDNLGEAGGAVGTYGSSISLLNSTLSGNTSNTGAAIRSVDSTVTVTLSTLADNSSANGAIFSQNSTVNLANTIIAGTQGGSGYDCRDSGGGSFVLSGVNLVQSPGNCSLTPGPSLLQADPLLAPLADNGGLTQTRLPVVGSPVVNAGDNAAVPGGVLYDQRGPGFDRILNTTVDLGAVETPPPEPQPGPDFVVTAIDNTADDGICAPAPGHCNLREAVGAANANADASTITFASALLGASPATITLTGSALPPITSEVTVQGAGITVDADGLGDIFYTFYATLALNDLTLTGVSASNNGGAVFSIGSELTINDSTLSGNTVVNSGGAVFALGGTVEILNSTLSENSSAVGAALFAGQAVLNLTHVTTSDNTVAANRGSIYLGESLLALNNSILANTQGGGFDCEYTNYGYLLTQGVNLVESIGNCSVYSGPAVVSGDPNLGPLADNGGFTFTHLPLSPGPAVDAADNSTIPVGLVNDQRGAGFPRISNGTADLGAIEGIPQAQTGADFVVTASDDSPNDGICAVAPGHCNLREAIIAANADADASTITFAPDLLEPSPVTITLAGSQLPQIVTEISIIGAGTTISGDGRSRIFDTETGANLSLDQFTLTEGNATTSGGGAINVVRGNLQLSNSTLTANTSQANGGALNVVYGGATIINSTVSGNSSQSRGAGLYVYRSTVELVHTTLSGNTGVAGVYAGGRATIGLTNTILANNKGFAWDCSAYNYSSNTPSITVNGANLVEDKSNCMITEGPDLLEEDPKLGVLANNGGPTLTHLPEMGSPVINAGAATAPDDLEFDQRGDGFPRVRGGFVDLGSVEFPSPPLYGEIAITPNIFQVNEDVGTFQLQITRSNGDEGAVSVTLSTFELSAEAGTDFIVIEEQLITFADGDSAPQDVTVTIINDDVFEQTESFLVTLSNVAGGASLGNSNSFIEISDDDPMPENGVLAIDPASIVVDEDVGMAQLTVTRMGGSAGEVSATANTANGTAGAPSDFTAVSNLTITFGDGVAASQTINIPIIDDNDQEPAEQFTVTLSAPQGGATLGNAIGTVEITDNDAPTEEILFEDSFETEE